MEKNPTKLMSKCSWRKTRKSNENELFLNPGREKGGRCCQVQQNFKENIFEIYF